MGVERLNHELAPTYRELIGSLAMGRLFLACRGSISFFSWPSGPKKRALDVNYSRSAHVEGTRCENGDTKGHLQGAVKPEPGSSGYEPAETILRHTSLDSVRADRAYNRTILAFKVKIAGSEVQGLGGEDGCS